MSAHDPMDVAREMVQASDVPSILLSLDYRILAANQPYRERYSPGIRLGEDRCHWISHHYPRPCDQHGESCPIQKCLATDGPARVLHVHHCRTGPEHVDVSMVPVRDASGEIVAFVEEIRTIESASTIPGEASLIGGSPAFNQALEAVRRVAPSELPVLLLGESGTGKEGFAKALHEESQRREGPFIPVECSGLTESLFESELFGHEEGAFTGALGAKVGLVEAARGGTLFLDEIGDIPLPMQVKLLRLLESRTYRRVGSVTIQHADFRLICATHADLEARVAAGAFRLDLLYRINAFPIEVPPLRARQEDLQRLCTHFLRDTGKSLGVTARHALLQHDFPGNVRELKHLMQRAALLCDGDHIESVHLGLGVSEGGPGTPHEIMTLAEAEQRYLRWALAAYEGERRELASLLGVSPRTLYRKLAELDPD